jgi:hypothetical protein
MFVNRTDADFTDNDNIEIAARSTTDGASLRY